MFLETVLITFLAYLFLPLGNFGSSKEYRLRFGSYRDSAPSHVFQPASIGTVC